LRVGPFFLKHPERMKQWKLRSTFFGLLGRFLGIYPLQEIAGLITPPKFNIAPENGWLEYYFPFGMVTFQGYVKLQVGISRVKYNSIL